MASPSSVKRGRCRIEEITQIAYGDFLHLTKAAPKKLLVFFETDDPKEIATAHIKKDVVVIGEHWLERLWYFTYATFCVYKFVESNQRRFQGTSISLSQFPELEPSQRILNAVHRAESESAPLEAENDFPRPFCSANGSEWEEATDKVFLAAIGFVFAHELAHIFGAHGSTEETLRFENLADGEAVEVFLKQCDPEEHPDYLTRYLGTTVVFLYACKMEMLRNERDQDHLPGRHRLSNMLIDVCPDPNELAWAISHVVLGLILSNSTLKEAHAELCKTKCDTHREVVDAFVDLIDRN